MKIQIHNYSKLLSLHMGFKISASLLSISLLSGCVTLPDVDVSNAISTLNPANWLEEEQNHNETTTTNPETDTTTNHDVSIQNVPEQSNTTYSNDVDQADHDRSVLRAKAQEATFGDAILRQQLIDNETDFSARKRNEQTASDTQMSLEEPNDSQPINTSPSIDNSQSANEHITADVMFNPQKKASKVPSQATIKATNKPKASPKKPSILVYNNITPESPQTENPQTQETTSSRVKPESATLNAQDNTMSAKKANHELTTQELLAKITKQQSSSIPQQTETASSTPIELNQQQLQPQEQEQVSLIEQISRRLAAQKKLREGNHSEDAFDLPPQSTQPDEPISLEQTLQTKSSQEIDTNTTPIQKQSTTPITVIPPSPKPKSTDGQAIAEPEQNLQIQQTIPRTPPSAKQLQKTLLASIYFTRFSGEISSSDFHALNQIANFLQVNQNTTIEIIGHASPGTQGEVTSGRLAAFQLSLARAAAIAAHLARSGIERTRMKLDARGTAEPANTQNSLEAELDNRRVEIYVTGVLN